MSRHPLRWDSSPAARRDVLGRNRDIEDDSAAQDLLTRRASRGRGGDRALWGVDDRCRRHRRRHQRIARPRRPLRPGCSWRPLSTGPAAWAWRAWRPCGAGQGRVAQPGRENQQLRSEAVTDEVDVCLRRLQRPRRLDGRSSKLGLRSYSSAGSSVMSQRSRSWWISSRGSRVGGGSGSQPAESLGLRLTIQPSSPAWVRK